MRPGEMGLYCGNCGDAMMIVRAHVDAHDNAYIWRCQGCEQSWAVAPAPVVTAKAMDSQPNMARVKAMR